MKTKIEANGIGTLVSDPVLKDVGTTKVAELSLAVNEYVGTGENKKQVASYFDFTAWDTAAEYLANHAKKGDRLVFWATPRQEKWEKDGEKKSRYIFRLNNFEIVPKTVRTEGE